MSSVNMITSHVLVVYRKTSMVWVMIELSMIINTLVVGKSGKEQRGSLASLMRTKTIW